MMDRAHLPVIVIGAGPIGLAAAAHLLQRGETPLVLEAGPTAGASIARWRHVRVFSPWEYNIDPASRALLERHGWVAPPAGEFPTGQALLDRYLLPLAALPEIAPHLRLEARVTAVSRWFHRSKRQHVRSIPDKLRMRFTSRWRRYERARGCQPACRKQKCFPNWPSR